MLSKKRSAPSKLLTSSNDTQRVSQIVAEQQVFARRIDELFRQTQAGFPRVEGAQRLGNANRFVLAQPPSKFARTLASLVKSCRVTKGKSAPDH